MRFRVSLRYAEPEVWRRFLLRSDASFLELHDAIQACGWTESHLWQFTDSTGRAVAGIPDAMSLYREPTPEASTVRLDGFFRTPETTCTYTYDFGDSWDHDVVFEGMEKHEERFERALLDGAGTFPPEDCGGIPGFARILEFARTGRDPWEDEESASHKAEQLDSTPFDLAAEITRFGAVLDVPREERRGPEPRPVPGRQRVEKIAHGTMERIMARVGPLLAQLGDELGLEIGVRRASFSEVNASIHVEVATVRDDGVVMDKLAVQFLERCQEFGLDPDDLGREFHHVGERLQVIGLKPRARLPVVCERVRSPEAPEAGRLRLSATCVREGLVRARPARRPLRLLPGEGGGGA